MKFYVKELLEGSIDTALTQGVQISPFDRLRMDYEDFQLLKAGDTGYERPFLRDTVITALLMEDPDSLRSILSFAASKQGVKKDPRTGEQPGAIFHEWDPHLNDGVELPDRSGKTTLYNACDSNALFLMGHEEYQRLTGDNFLFERQEGNIIAATDYILRHLDENNLFMVDPKHSDADGYALRVTYWKDSHLKGRENGEPLYPVVYPLAHIQNMAGLRSASRLLDSPKIAQKAEDMRQALVQLYDDELSTLNIAIDKGGKIKGISSDVLHALFYLEPGDIDPQMLKRFLKASSVLETTHGYRTLSADNADEVEDSYHAKTVWTHEQALIHMGARKHLVSTVDLGDQELADELGRVIEVSSRIVPYMKEYPERNNELHIITATGEIVPGGCDPQLWAIGARHYFENQKAA